MTRVVERTAFKLLLIATKHAIEQEKTSQLSHVVYLLIESIFDVDLPRSFLQSTIIDRRGREKNRAIG